MTEAPGVDDLIERLASADATTRDAAEATLVGLGAPALPALMHATADGRVSVRRHAVFALGRIGDPSAIPVLAARFRDDVHDAVWHAATRALRAFGERAAPSLLPFVDDQRPAGIWALSALAGLYDGRGKSADPDTQRAAVVDTFRRLLVSRDANTRLLAASGLLSVLGDRAVDDVTPLLTDPDRRCRAAVATELVDLGWLRGEPVVRAALADQGLGPGYERESLERAAARADELRRAGPVRE